MASYQFADFVHEHDLLRLLPTLDTIQQIELDIALHDNAIKSGNFDQHRSLLATDSKWKNKLIDVFRGKERNPKVISSLFHILHRDIHSHQGRVANKLTGSNRWNDAWAKVYKQWLEKLRKM